MNLCLESNKCSGEFAACVNLKNDGYASYGFSDTTQINKITNDHYQIVYQMLNASKDSNCNNKAEMVINLICAQKQKQE